MKVCTVCKTEHPATNEFFYRNKNCKDGLSFSCKNCCKEYHVKNKENISQRKKKFRINNKDYISRQRKKIYTKNKEHILQYDKTYRTEHKDYYLQYHKEYYAENKNYFAQHNKEYYINHKEYRLQYGKTFRAEHKDYCSQYRKEYNAEHGEYIAQCKKEYRAKHKECVSRYKKEYYKTNNGHSVCLCCSQKRRAIKKSLPATLTVSQWNQIKLYFNNRCAYCEEEKPLTQDHFIALNKGGEYTQNNIVPACRSCNSRKCNALFFIWFPKQSFYSKTREKKILKFLNYHEQTQQMRLFI
jgi:hypothetical protein